MIRFVTERFRVDMIALLILVASVFLLSGGLAATGLTERIGALIGREVGGSKWRTIAVVTPAVAAFAAFSHHLMVTATMLPILMQMSKEREIPPSRVLCRCRSRPPSERLSRSIGAHAFLAGAMPMIVSRCVTVAHAYRRHCSRRSFPIQRPRCPLGPVAVASFLTPISHHANLLIINPGQYPFDDVLRVGVPLTVLIEITSAWLSQWLELGVPLASPWPAFL